MCKVETNRRFDKLTNSDIRTHYRNIEVYLLPSDFLAAFAYWAVAQNPNRKFINIVPSLRALEKHIRVHFKDFRVPEKFTYDSLREIVNENMFESIPEILDLNKSKPGFIDIGALARNVFYMILRQRITQS